ncbi:MAG: hypothetical protein FJ333_07685 [Sphingomonadales bacterium]|nr:hypothetical protein [Sphingomonadales bacterium]
MENQLYESNKWNEFNFYAPSTINELIPRKKNNHYYEHQPWNLPLRNPQFGYSFPSNQWRAFA